MGAFSNSIKKASAVSRPQEGEVLEFVDTARIRCAPQIRLEDSPGFTIASLNELAESIRANKQSQPVLLRKDPLGLTDFLMVAGERRYRACKIAGVPVLALVREMTDKQARIIQIHENIDREDLTQHEVSSALAVDYAEHGRLDAVAELWGRSINWVSERLKFLAAVQSDGIAHEAVATGLTNDVSTVNALAKLEQADPQSARALVDAAKADGSINMRTEARRALKEAKSAVPSNKQTPKVTGTPATNDANASDDSQPISDADRYGAAPLPALQLVPPSPHQVAGGHADVLNRPAPTKYTFDPFVAALHDVGGGELRYIGGGWEGRCENGVLEEKFDTLDELLSKLSAAGITRMEISFENMRYDRDS